MWQWVAVASAGPYASLHLAQDRQPHQHSTTVFYRPDALPAAQPTFSVYLSISLSVCTGHVSQPWQNSWTDRDAVSEADSCGPIEPCIRWDAHWCLLANTVARRRCGLTSDYVDHLLSNRPSEILLLHLLHWHNLDIIIIPGLSCTTSQLVNTPQPSYMQ